MLTIIEKVKIKINFADLNMRIGVHTVFYFLKGKFFRGSNRN